MMNKKAKESVIKGAAIIKARIDDAVMKRLRAPFECEYIAGHWRIYDANDDAIASVSGLEEGYARLIVLALNEHYERRERRSDPEL
jgi:hypothetical protein